MIFICFLDRTSAPPSFSFRHPPVSFLSPFSVNHFTIIAVSSRVTDAQSGLQPSVEKLDRSSPLAFLIKGDNPKICIHRTSLPVSSDLLRNEDLTAQEKPDHEHGTLDC
ncbi:unnamed protein product [Victoria cruziana]